MKETVTDFYREEFRRYTFLHQTSDSGRTFMCFSNFENGEIDIFETSLWEQFVFCPFCGKKLGRRIKKESGHKIIWTINKSQVERTFTFIGRDAFGLNCIIFYGEIIRD